MKVLIVCSGNAPDGESFSLELHQAFINEQVESLKKRGIEFDYFFVNEKGLNGYFKHYCLLKTKLRANYDLIHAHNGLSGLISNIQKSTSVITTYHGSDINILPLRVLSYVPILLSSSNIFVSHKLKQKVIFKRRAVVIPCGVDLELFNPLPSKVSNSITTSQNAKKILFSSSFSVPVKNHQLALEAIKSLGENDVQLIELKNRSREEVCQLMGDSDLLLLTSYSEGSPMVIKEAMACNCPIVSTDVGDVRDVIGETEGCYITSFDPHDVAHKIRLALEFSRTKGRTNGRQRIIDLGLDSESIAGRILKVYESSLMT